MSASNNAPSWRNPSTENQAKFHVVPLPEDFEPTEEEKGLLAMYETIKRFDKEAKRLKEQESRKKLEAKQAEFVKLKQKTRRNRKRPQKSKAEADEGDSSPMEDDESYASSEEGDEETDFEKRVKKKLESLADEVEEKRQAMAEVEAKAEEERSKREVMLATNKDTAELGRLAKRKKTDAPDDDKALLMSMMKEQTPPHDFSKKLGLKPGKGKILFPSAGTESSWTPPQSAISPNEGAFLVELEDFDIAKASNGTGNNTLAIKFHAPSDSKRFSVNIAGPDHDDFNSVLFHFNPRHFEKGGQMVVNDKQETIWGQAISLPLSQVPVMFGQTSITLQIQINGDGFDIFIEDKHCARLEHRKELPSKPCSLFLQFPSTDDYGSKCYAVLTRSQLFVVNTIEINFFSSPWTIGPENWVVYKAWWGNKPIMTKGDVSGIAGVNSFDAMHPVRLNQSACRHDHVVGWSSLNKIILIVVIRSPFF